MGGCLRDTPWIQSRAVPITPQHSWKQTPVPEGGLGRQRDTVARLGFGAHTPGPGEGSGKLGREQEQPLGEGKREGDAQTPSRRNE